MKSAAVCTGGALFFSFPLDFYIFLRGNVIALFEFFFAEIVHDDLYVATLKAVFTHEGKINDAFFRKFFFRLV